MRTLGLNRVKDMSTIGKMGHILHGAKLEGGPWTGGPTSLKLETLGVHPYIDGIGSDASWAGGVA